ncbi:hypothetical protein [Nonomuraea lactucae]|uniref:hypothetical protein n=1 Tax=Nonomuraea lactucae TaxID=2249762 RepID=UPI000DE4E36D|nr:hypothetical protein [Nonomuraea lactucae]
MTAALTLALAGPLSSVPAHADEPALMGDVVVFNDEIVEPVSAPISTCGGALPMFSTASSTCADASRVSDDDA